MPPDRKAGATNGAINGAEIKAGIEQINGRIDALDKRLDSVESRLLPDGWKWGAGVTATVIVAFVTFYVLHHVPSQIRNEIAPLQLQVNSVATEIKGLNDKTASLETAIKDLNRDLNKRIDDYLVSIAEKPRKLKDTLGRVASPGNQEEAKSRLQVARELLRHAEQKRTVLKPEEIKQLALPLLKVNYRDEKARQEAWETAKEFADYRTFVNGVVFGVPRPGEPEHSPDGPLNLASNFVWKDTVFANSQIDISAPGAKLILDHVRFVNCDFGPLKESAEGKRLLEEILSSPGPYVSVTLLNHQDPKEDGSGS